MENSANFILPKIDHKKKTIMDNPANWVETSCRYSWSEQTTGEPSYFDGVMVIDTADRTMTIESGFEDDLEAIAELLKAGIISDFVAEYLKQDFIGYDFAMFCAFVHEKYPELIGYETKWGRIYNV